MKIELRSVYDGHIVTLDDDGHAKGNPSKPNSRRAHLLHTLSLLDAEDNEPIFMLMKRPAHFSEGGLQHEPIRGQVWDKRSDERLAYHLDRRRGVRDARPRPAPLPLAAAVAKVESDQTAAAPSAPGASRAGVVSGAEAVKAAAETVGAPEKAANAALKKASGRAGAA